MADRPIKTARLVLPFHPHGKSWCGAFMAGLERHGIRRTTSPDADLLVMWGVRSETEIAEQRARGGEICVLECGYIGDRLKWASASLGGGLNGRGRFAPPPAGDDGDRFKRLWPGFMKPWRDRLSGYALICGQVQTDRSVWNVPLGMVYAEAAEECRRIGIEPVYRPHPVGGSPAAPNGCSAAPGETLAQAMEGAAMVVTWNSNSGVDAALAGVPVVALDRGSMAREVASPHVAPPWFPDRSKWAAALAWKQWTDAEFASGAAWDNLKRATR